MSWAWRENTSPVNRGDDSIAWMLAAQGSAKHRDSKAICRWIDRIEVSSGSFTVYLSILHENLPRRVFGDVLLVRHHHDSLSLMVQFPEQVHDGV